ncbi:sulfite exporter TauE/SafE family protein [Corynebacterium epidermidicanis]|uniref:Probable membrane transporter protein n=1 Tax=Corynebacterium epidermidicanis TaxID=1050174 RepID=A0A0G3GW72_9CORY|nr:sulfite exporter TauE/SafE family protein [Corynebacterium epidermidicanis]AKK03763.1 putative permease [Corynebacterium epidermidicanis]
MRTLTLIAISGLLAQLVDGALGMGFGVTSTTCLLYLAALGPAQASAIVHASELGTTLASGLSHWKFGNVDWKVALRLGIPGAIGAFAGSTFLSFVSLSAARPWTSFLLCAIGAHLVWRFSRGRIRRTGSALRTVKFLPGLGLLGGFVDASGGGGWGPITSSTLLSATSDSPRRIVGTVNTAEFLVTSAATLGFAIGLWHELISQFWLIIALLIGGVIAAPIGAWLTSRLNPSLLGGLVGTTLVATNIKTFSAAAIPVVIVVGAILSYVGYRKAREAAYLDPEADARLRSRGRTHGARVVNSSSGVDNDRAYAVLKSEEPGR